VANSVEARASVRHVRITPQKARRVVNLIRGMKANEALTVLQFAPQAAGETVYKVLASAVANATHNLGVRDSANLYVSQAFVDEGSTLKRFRPRAQGRAYRINKRTSHITICVAEKGGVINAPAAKASKKASADEAPAKKAAAKKTTAKKATAKKAAEKAPAKKAAAKKTTAKKTTAKKAAGKGGAQ
jgi:large subunit ribosomal protein L22